MPIQLNFDRAIFRWQAKHGQKMTYAELAKRSKISEATIYRFTSSQPTKIDLRKLNRICKVLECEPADLLERVDTKLGAGLEAAQWQYEARDEQLRTLKQYAGANPKDDDEE